MRCIPTFFSVTPIAATIVFFAGSVLVAQDHLIGDGHTAGQVIQLQSFNSPANPATTPADETSRSVQPVVTPQNQGGPKVLFEEIKPGSVPSVLSTPAIAQSRRVQETTLQPSNPFVAKRSTLEPMPNPKPSVAVDSVNSNSAPKWNYTPSAVNAPEVGTDNVLSMKGTAPVIETQIDSPRFINLNQTASMRIKLQNVGQVAARNVKLTATLPTHAKFARALPSPNRSEGQTHEFILANLGIGQAREIVIELTPTQKLSLDIATNVVIENNQTTAMVVREPQLRLRIEGPSQANIGQQVTHQLVVENTGDGIATDIRLKTTFPDSIRPTKSNGEITIPDLQPGRSMVIDLESFAKAPGKTELTAVASSIGVETQTAKASVTIYQPELEVSAVGPKMNFVNREGIYTVKLENTGEVDVSNVNILLQVPAGMEVTTISREATVDAESGMLVWTFDKIAAKSEEQIQLKTLALAAGQQVCNIAVRSNETRDKQLQLATAVATRAELSVSIKNQSGPVQVGGKAQFVVVVENKGSSRASDIALNIELPPSLKPVPQEGINVLDAGNSVVFRDGQIEPGQKREFVFSAVGVAQGEHVVRSTLTTTGTSRSIIAEGSVFVYETSESRVSEALTPNVPR